MESFQSMQPTFGSSAHVGLSGRMTPADRPLVSSRVDTTNPQQGRFPLQAEHRDHGPLWVLQLSGEADLATRELLEQELAEAEAEAKTRERLVVDVTRLRFCDVASVALILSAARSTRIGPAGANGPVRRVFEFLDPFETVPRYGGLQSATLRS